MKDQELLEPTGLQKELEDDVDKKNAEKIERENAEKAKNARIKLEEAAHLQRSTVDEMHKQNEALQHAKQVAESTYENSKEARKKANELLYEKDFCTIAPKARAKFKNWKEDRGSDQDTKSSGIDSKRSMRLENPYAKDNMKHAKVKSNIANPTDKELKKLYEVTLQINDQADEQEKAAENQKSILKDAIKTSNNANKEIKRAGEKLNDFNSSEK